MAGGLRLLNETARAVLADERRLLADLTATLARSAAPEADRDALAAAIEQLDDLFLLVVVGEFNAGKSAFINALVGHDVLEEGVTPTTSRVTVLRFGEVASRATPDADGLARVTAPSPLLHNLHIVDTPGTNAVLREHEAVTQRFVPRADLVLFLTSADRPFTESERAFLERIRDWGKKILVIVNKVDILEGPAQVEEVLAFVRDQARRLLGLEPTVMPASARRAKQARSSEAGHWAESGFADLERYLAQTLDEAERVRLKLLNPLGVADRTLSRLDGGLREGRTLLTEDVAALAGVDDRLRGYAEDTERDFAFRMADIEKLLVEMERRGHDHFDDTLRLGRVLDLIDRARLERRFAEEVVGDTPRRIEQKANQLVDWLVEADLRQWQVVNELLVERRAAHRERLSATALPAGFRRDRARLLESVGREAQRIVDTYDRTAEASLLSDRARQAVATSAAIEVGAAGLGAVVAAVATTAAADVTGLAMAGVLATLGLLVIPNRRRRAKQELREKVSALREKLGRSLRQAFETELRDGLARLREGLAPYARFVHDEQQRLAAATEDVEALRARATAIRERVARL